MINLDKIKMDMVFTERVKCDLYKIIKQETPVWSFHLITANYIMTRI